MARRINGLSHVQLLHDFGRTMAQAVIGQHDQCLVRRFQHNPHIQLRAAVLADRLPVVAAARDLPRWPLTLEGTFQNDADAAEGGGRIADDVQRRHMLNLRM